MSDLLYDAILGSPSVAKKAPSEGVQPISDEDLKHPNVIKGLQYINAYEGKPKSNQMFGYKEFNDLSKHPNIKIPFTDKGDTTTAAGTYQIIAPTWEEQAKKQGLKDFSPENQDRAAVGIMRDIGALDAFKEGNFDKAKQLLGTKWASIPGSTIGKSTGQIPKLNTEHEAILPSGDMLYNAILGNDIKTGVAKTATVTNLQPDVPLPVQNVPKKEEQMNWFQRNMNAPEASKKLQGAGEAIATIATNPIVTGIGMVKGLVQSLPEIASGKAPEIAAKIALDFQKEHGYSPTSQKGKEYLQSIGETFKNLVETATGSSTSLPPIIPELAGITAGRYAVGQMENQFAKAKAGPLPSAKVYDFPATQTERPMAGVGAAKTEFNPYPAFTGQETARGEFPQIKAEKMAGDVKPQEQSTRAQIINEINPTGRPRTGLITGNENTIRNEYASANSSERTPAGDILKQEIANEQQALPNYAKKIIANTGADQLLPDNEARAMRIRNALDTKEGLEKDINTAKKEIYEEARQKTGDNPISTASVEGLFNDPQFKAGAGLRGNEGVFKSAEDLINLARTVGFKDEFGNTFAPNSVGAWDAVKHSLNQGWSPSNSAMIGKINRAIDKDIASAGGSELLKKADAIHKAEKDLFGSKGIKDLLTEEDANGVQTGIPNEKLMQKLNLMPNAQWKHIYDTLGKAANGEVIGISISPEVKAAARSAQAEMKGAIVRDIYEAGAAKAGEWNPNSVNNKANFYNSKIKHAFDPEEIRQIHTLNVGGYLMPAKSPYEGGGLQLQRVAKLSEKLPIAGRALGAVTRIPGAETAGGWAGEKGSKFFKGRTLRKEAEALEKELEANKQLGTKLSDMIGK
jgi:muramidase (phage lysozyme)